MHIGIDATNIRQGGGLTHLVELLSSFQKNQPFNELSIISVWCSSTTARLLPTDLSIRVYGSHWLEKGAVPRFFFQHVFLSLVMKKAGCNIFFSLGGTLPALLFMKSVVICQNMLPFDRRESVLFGIFSWMHLKMQILRMLHGFSYRRASGVIFLTHYAKNVIEDKLGVLVKTVIIPHGINPRFFRKPITEDVQFSPSRPFKVLYVSILMPYKHQIEVAIAVNYLRRRGIPLECSFIGSSWSWYGRLFSSKLAELDSQSTHLKHLGALSFNELHMQYHSVDAFIFASSCENLPNIMIEAMASGLPIVALNKAPMNQILMDAGLYFDDLTPQAISKALLALFESNELRTTIAKKAFDLAQIYSWDEACYKTLLFLEDVYSNT